MNFVDLIKLDSTFKRKLEKFFNIHLENCKYIGGNGFDNISTCYIFSYKKENFSVIVVNDDIVIFSKYENVYQSKVVNELFGVTDLDSGKITALYAKTNNTTDVYFQKPNFSDGDGKIFKGKIIDVSKLTIMKKLGGMAVE